MSKSFTMSAEEYDTEAIRAVIILAVIAVLLMGSIGYFGTKYYQYRAEKPYREACLRNPEIMYDGNCTDTAACLRECTQRLQEASNGKQ